MLLEQRQREPTQECEVLRAISLRDSAVVFSKTYVQLSMQVVFDAPMISQGLGIILRARLAAANEVTDLGARRRRSFDVTCVGAHSNHRQLLPIRNVADPRRIHQDRIRTFFGSTMSTLLGLELVVLQPGEVRVERMPKARLNVV